MQKIASFQVDHNKLLPGIYVSRKDRFGPTVITTFDIRMKRPNVEPPLDVPALHSLEHLAATFLRSHEVWKDRVVYVGPMGCRTGIYLLLEGDLDSKAILPLVKEFFDWAVTYNGPLPGASAVECGNWMDHNPITAAYEAKRFAREVLEHIGPEQLVYP